MPQTEKVTYTVRITHQIVEEVTVDAMSKDWAKFLATEKWEAEVGKLTRSYPLFERKLIKIEVLK